MTEKANNFDKYYLHGMYRICTTLEKLKYIALCRNKKISNTAADVKIIDLVCLQ